MNTSSATSTASARSRERHVRVALITGASRGLGLVIAHVLATRGYHLVIGARNASALDGARQELLQHAVTVVALPGDVTDGAARARWVAAARELGGLDVLVNNASMLGGIEPLTAFDVERLERVLAVNTTAPIALTQLALPLLTARHGLIVNITSDAAHGAYPGWGAYGATKAALELATRTLAEELREQGVSAVVVDPGDMRTRMHQEAFPNEDISNRPLPDVTSPFWDWLFARTPRCSVDAASRRNRRCPMAADSLAFALDALDPSLEASEPPEARGLRRDDVRLLVSDLDRDEVVHAHFRDLPEWLAAGDVLVVNTSGTLNAAVPARLPNGTERVLHLSTSLPGGFWTVELREPSSAGTRPCREPLAGTLLELPDGGRATVLAPYPHGGSSSLTSRLWLASLELPEPVPTYLDRVGSPIRYGYVPRAWPSAMYQTVFASEPGSAEMPSAGRPFTAELVTRLVARGVQIAPLILHTGVSSLEDHEPPYEERYRVPAETAALVSTARQSGRRVIAVGTTAVRALETVTDESGHTSAGQGWTTLVITPDRPLRAVTGLITGFHEPKATHLAILERVVARRFASHRPVDDSREHRSSGADGRQASERARAELARAYRAAREAGYLWHEFGDVHLIVA